MSPSANWPIIDELEKQYDVVQVDPANPITEKYDVLLAVQPSSLGPEEMDNFIAAVQAAASRRRSSRTRSPVSPATVPATSAPAPPPAA